MRRWLAVLAFLVLLHPGCAQAHIGSPDVFYEGMAGPYPVSIVIRVPVVVPGRAQIEVRVRSTDVVTVAVAPIASKTAVSNTPPTETAQAVAGETNLFSGELWLMTRGAYGIDIRVRGPSGQGAVEVPVNSVATHQLPLPPWLGNVLAGLAAVLFCGGVAIIAAAAGESILLPGVAPGTSNRRRYWKGAVIAAAVFSLGLIGGKRWWNSDEANFHSRLREGGWPGLTAKIQTNGSQRILNLSLADAEVDPKDLRLARDHGKLLHIYLTRLPKHDVFAHLHPAREAGMNSYDVVLPPLPEGDYAVLCDLTLAKSGFSSTATNVVHISADAAGPAGAGPLKPDPDDSWALNAPGPAQDNAGDDAVCRLANGGQVVWKAHPALRERQDAGLSFEVRDAAGKPAEIEPYMGMLSHAAVLRADGRVFAHLHPSGNYSMAAQSIFDKKLGRSTHASDPDPVCGADHGGTPSPSIITLPYEFPAAGNYRLWVQFKTGGQVQTAVFNAAVQPASL